MEQELQKESKCSFYALEQLRQTAEAILRGSQRLLKCRAGVEKYRTAQLQRAYAYYLELQKTRDALLAAFGDAQRYLLELEESALAGKAGQLQAGLSCISFPRLRVQRRHSSATSATGRLDNRYKIPHRRPHRKSSSKCRSSKYRSLSRSRL